MTFKYPIYLSCIPFIKEESLKCLMKQLALDNAVKNVNLSRDMFTYTSNGVTSIFKIKPAYEEDAEMFTTYFLTFLKKINFDMTKYKILDCISSIKNEQIRWKSIRSIAKKYILITSFVCNLKKQISIEHNQMVDILSTIQTALLLKTITEDDIICDNCGIISIKQVSIVNGMVKLDESIL